MKKIFFLFLLFCCLKIFAVSENTSESTSEKPFEKSFQNHLISMLGFQALQTAEEEFIFSPSANLMFMRSKMPGVESAQPDSITIGAGYSQSYYTKGLGVGEVHQLHGCSLMGSLNKDKNSYLAMVSSNGQIPFSHIKTVTGALLYTRQLVKTDNIDFLLGGGLVIGDFDLTIKDVDIYFFLLPVFRFTYKNDFFSGSIALMGPPTIQLTLFPKSMFRFKGSCGIAGVKSIRDLTFDCSLLCYPLIHSRLGELLSLSAGVMNKVSGTTLRDKTKYVYQYYSVYGEINMVLATLRCGYNFDGKKFVNRVFAGDMYKGFFASLNVMFML